MYYMEKIVTGKYEAVLQAALKALKGEGFGVLTEIDVTKTLRKKLNVDFRSYTILGACNPALAHQALKAEAQIGILLPCNVVVQEDPEGRGISVSAVNPLEAMAAVKNEDLECVAGEVTERLKRVLASLPERV
jgi:uncharacterized protein (DUF302 family)